MARNYTNESKWQSRRYTLIKGYIDRELGDSLRAKLKANNETMANWIRKNAIKYLGEE